MSTSEFPGVLSVLAHVVCRLAGVLVTCQIILKTPILRTDDPSSQHRRLAISLYKSEMAVLPPLGLSACLRPWSLENCGRGQALWSFWCYWVALQNLFYELCNLDLIWIECFLSICVLPQDDPAFCHIAPGRSREGTVLCLL